jgi:hypothetical protein
MYSIVGTIDHRKVWIRHSLPLMKRGEGVMILLDPKQIGMEPEISGRDVVVYKPNGDECRFVVHSTVVRNSIVGIFLKGVFSDEIPIGSRIKW